MKLHRKPLQLLPLQRSSSTLCSLHCCQPSGKGRRALFLFLPRFILRPLLLLPLCVPSVAVVAGEHTCCLNTRTKLFMCQHTHRRPQHTHDIIGFHTTYNNITTECVHAARASTRWPSLCCPSCPPTSHASKPCTSGTQGCCLLIA